MGEFVLPCYPRHRLTADITDMMTSKSSTLPYDADTMQQMTRLVHNAKGTLGTHPEVILADFVAQGQRQVLCTILLQSVSHSMSHVLLYSLNVRSVSQARLLSFFGRYCHPE